MASYYDADRASLKQTIALSATLLPACAVFALFTLRPTEPRHLRVSAYFVASAAVSLTCVHAASIALGAMSLRHLPADSDDPEEAILMLLKAQDALRPIISLSSGLYSIAIFAGCRAAFWEMTAHSVFRRHDTGRWILLAFDLLIVLSATILFIVNLVSQTLDYRHSVYSTSSML
ncbi:hypothetical protein EXIGLDRAFT_227160 [Exidia glandulosa HHB12029]|uniref:Uncharacterized protein n=1 Tax=Exidia glandulosa HHB12029 TaxID=1314781 RepID=A0A165E8A7_EXIGL|nr:hypothetical protein EXIGLDRAFT_227160 [Exidia glandulosa HHB12029]